MTLRRTENNPTGGLPRLLTLRDVADCLAVSVPHLRREIREGRLAAHRLGRSVRVAEADLAAYLATRRRASR